MHLGCQKKKWEEGKKDKRETMPLICSTILRGPSQNLDFASKSRFFASKYRYFEALSTGLCVYPLHDCTSTVFGWHTGPIINTASFDSNAPFSESLTISKTQL